MMNYDKVYLGVVEDNRDPEREGKCRIRVFNMFDGIPVEDIPWAMPWKNNNGTSFDIPDEGKIVSVEFEDGDIYRPMYKYGEHYNVNLENKLKNLSDDDYLTMASVLFDHKTQIYRNNSEGLKIDHEYSNINITKNGNINLNIRDNNSKIQVGSPDATQAAILGTKYMEWMDKFVDELLGSSGGPYLGNLTAPIIPHPKLTEVLLEYKNSRTIDFLSNHIWLVDNNEVLPQERDYIDQKGDNWKSITDENTITKKSENNYKPEERPETGRPIILNDTVPNDNMIHVINESNIKTIEGLGTFENGKIPIDRMVKNRFLSKDLGGDAAYLMAEASNALDLMMNAYNSSNFIGKQKIIFTDGYRSYERQEALYQKYGAGRAAKPGRSNHGWGIAIDMYWGVQTKMYKNKDKRSSGYKHPVYMWFFENGNKFGWYNPEKLRDNTGTDEWWHWEYYGTISENKIIASAYDGDFTQQDIDNIKSYGGTFKV